MNRQPTALIVDDEPDILALLRITLERMGIAVKEAADLNSARQQLGTGRFSLCLTDMRLPDGNGLDLIDFIQAHYPQTPIAVITAHGNVEAAIRALKNGAYDFLSKPVDLKRLRKLVSDTLKLDDCPQVDRRSRNELLGDSVPMREIRSTILKLSRSQAPVYIRGESGTGKEMVARLIHQKSSRHDKPFVAVNCGAIPTELAESEFFGHTKGSFSGAIQDKQGFFQAAEGGTLFLDEVADLPLHLQVKLLRSLQEKQIRRVGDNHEIPIDIRILTATHKNLARMVAEREFREDLFYRINVIELKVPPLRERPEDIPQLADHILQRLASRNRTPAPVLDPETLSALRAYPFPGNVRELENLLERAMAFSDGHTITLEDINFPDQPPDTSVRQIPAIDEQPPLAATVLEAPPRPLTQSLENYMEEVEKITIMQALEKHRWNRTATAKSLGITFRALRYRLKKLGVE